MNDSRRLKTTHAALALILGASVVANAQSSDFELRWGRPATPRAGACFYRDPYFRGDYFCARPGENIAFLSPGMNDQVSSIRAFGDTEVTIFQGPRFRGPWARLQGDVRDLRREGWNDVLSSIRVGTDYGGYHGPYGNHPSGYGLGRIETEPWQDEHVRQGEGPYDRYDRRAVRPGDSRSAAASPGSDGRETADAAVRRLYREVLQREPDAQGLADYRNRMLNDRWTEEDVREAMVKSPEYRQRSAQTPQQNAEDVVARAYRSVLGREPDPASRGYVDRVLREHWTEADVSRELRKSPEYKAKHPGGGN